MPLNMFKCRPKNRNKDFVTPQLKILWFLKALIDILVGCRAAYMNVNYSNAPNFKVAI